MSALDSNWMTQGYFPSAAVVQLETLLNEWGESKEMEMFISTLAL